ncbi:hypothetical protein [Bradyrhizobium sp. LMTR 3]|uniref:hypothetical protein n=1 Tax=Bradyrhizobium sp. LMTR 3 TaxID=189873 RepID=UPI000810E229|nr:hypothetical protein [Bradyrhizobium sp. LMTR 3]OCK62615.1 hypothetical protein LMTR3_05185 [Bradyrhizobium sp. LMTR 3]
MGGDFMGRWRAGSGRRTARQAKAGQYSAKVLACGSWLLTCVIVDGMAMQTALAETAAPAGTGVADTEKEQSGHGAAQASRTQKSEPETVLRQPEVQKPAPEAAVQMPEARKSSHEAKDLPVPQLVLPGDLAKKIGQKIWLNETGGRRDAITSWNANEEFASLGIGHFIWFPVGKWLPFEESFPALLEFMRKKNVRLPGWLDQTQIPANPWTSRAEFRRNANSPQMNELRQFLLGTVAEQTQFMMARAQGAMEKILKTTPDGSEREHIVIQFTRVVRASENFYPLIDYINFKGEGTNPNETAMNRETGRRQGWGLKQVLLKMNGDTSDPKVVRAEFADAAQFVLQQRIRNLPSNRVFEVGWMRRVATYRRPIADTESSPERALRKSLRVTAAQ